MTTPASSSTRAEVIVVGGGIGGLGCALGLARQGVGVRVLERSAEFGEAGAGIQLAPNCTRILSDYGLLDEARAAGVLPGRMIIRDALDASVLTQLDLADVERRYGFPYLVIHRSDLHALLLRACERAGVLLLTDQHVQGCESDEGGARVRLADGSIQHASVVIAADGLHSVTRPLLAADEVVSSNYVAYRAAIPISEARGINTSDTDVVVYIGPRCHFVHYPLRGGEMLNQVAVFESPSARAGSAEWGGPEELDAAFTATCDPIRSAIDLMWRDRWWRMYDRDPIDTWVLGRVALLGDAAHPPLQYLAQGAVMAIEDGWVLARQAARLRDRNGIDWERALAAYQAVRVQHCRRVVTVAREWGKLWHLDGAARLARNDILRERDTYDYSFVDWLYGPTALTPKEEPAMFATTPLLPRADGQG